MIFLVAVLVESEEPNQDLVLRSLGDLAIGVIVVSAVACGALLWRRSRPLIVLAVTLGAVAVAAAFDYSEMIGFAMLVALYSVGRYVEDDRWSYLGLGGALAVMAVTTLTSGDDLLANLAFGMVFLFGTWYVGRRVRFRGERAAQLERERAAEARRTIAEERTRIARELHDVVAHQVTLMTVQAGAAKTVAADDPEAAYQAMEAVEAAGREALGELRHLLGVLRPDADARDLGPQPGIGDLPALADQFEEAGLLVSLECDGLGDDLPAAVELSAYRIVQEALTNVLKHAGPGSRAEVRLTREDAGMIIEVLNDGRKATTVPGSGHGIVGMRERAQLLGGSLDAGPGPAGGFQVVAHLPIRDEAM